MSEIEDAMARLEYKARGFILISDFLSSQASNLLSQATQLVGSSGFFESPDVTDLKIRSLDQATQTVDEYLHQITRVADSFPCDL